MKTNFAELDKYPDLESIWSLIPNSVDVEWRDDVSDFKLEKEVFSRIIWIVAKPVAEEKKEERKAYLLTLFSDILAKDQLKQITTFLSYLKKEDLDKIRTDYLNFQKSLQV